MAGAGLLLLPLVVFTLGLGVIHYREAVALRRAELARSLTELQLVLDGAIKIVLKP